MNHARIILAPDYEAAATAKAIEYFHVEHAHQFRVVVTKLGPLKAKDRLAALSSLRHQLVSDHFHFARLVQPSAPNRRRSVGAPPLSLRLVIWLAQAEKKFSSAPAIFGVHGS